MALKDLALSAAEAKDTALGSSAALENDAPKYPYGTMLDLNGETLSKIGMKKLPMVGEKVRIVAEGTITRVSEYQEQDGTDRCVGIQLTAMDVSAPSQRDSASDRLYGGNPLDGD